MTKNILQISGAPLNSDEIELPATFYHGTSLENWRLISRRALTLPRDHKRCNYEGGLAARSDAVYLTTCFAGVYAANAALRAGDQNRLVLIEVTVAGLVPADFIADEDGVEASAARATVNCPDPDMPATDWRQSLRSVGSVAYPRRLSRGHIRRAVLLDTVKVPAVGALLVAPVIRPGYYAAHGEKYNLVTRRMFGEELSGADIYAAETDRYDPVKYIDFWNRLDVKRAVTEL